MNFILVTAIWCPSCIIMRPRYFELLKKSNYPIKELDFDDDSDEVDKLNIGSTLPVLIVRKDNLEIGRIIGEKSIKELEGIFYDKGIF